MTILYAEDDSMTVMEVQEKLENNGYEVIVAYDGNEALEKFIACKPDLIVLDVDMPGKDGLEVLQFIRLQDSQTPVIIYSCLIDEEKQIKGLEWGANVYLLKNYSPTLLLAQIQRCIARSGEEVIRLSIPPIFSPSKQITSSIRSIASLPKCCFITRYIATRGKINRFVCLCSPFGISGYSIVTFFNSMFAASKMVLACSTPNFETNREYKNR